jgi:hypothetical protein
MTLMDTAMDRRIEATDPALVDGLRLVPSPGRGRAARRATRALLRDTWCAQGVPLLIGAPQAGTTLVAIEWPTAGPRFVELVAAVREKWDLEVTVVATATRTPYPSDVVTSAGAAALARSIGEVVGHRPEWEVQYGRTAVRAARAFIEHQRPGVVAIPHSPHRPHARCDALDLALSTSGPLLLV